MNKVSARLAAGINEIHPLLIDRLNPKVWLKEKATVQRGDKETLYYEFRKNTLSVLSSQAPFSRGARPQSLDSPLQLLVNFQ